MQLQPIRQTGEATARLARITSKSRADVAAAALRAGTPGSTPPGSSFGAASSRGGAATATPPGSAGDRSRGSTPPGSAGNTPPGSRGSTPPRLHRVFSGNAGPPLVASRSGSPGRVKIASMVSHSMEEPPLARASSPPSTNAARSRPSGGMRATAPPAPTAYPASAPWPGMQPDLLPELPPELQNYTLFPGQGPQAAIQRTASTRRSRAVREAAHQDTEDELKVIPSSMSFGDDDASVVGGLRRHNYRPPPLKSPDGRVLISTLSGEQDDVF